MKDKKENNLDENYKRYKKFFDLSLDLLCIANVDGYFTLVNPAFSETLGWTVEEMISKPFLDFVHPDDVNSTIKEVEKLKDGIPTTSFINRYRTKSGEYVWMKWVSTPDQRTGELFAVAHNITDFIKNNQQLKQSIEFKDIFLANTSHEIRTPLNAILGFSDLLQKTALNKEQKEYVDTINLASQNLLVVVNDILDFAKIDAGKIELEQQPISIREVLSLVIKLAAPKFKTKHLKFITSIDQDLPKTVIGDAVRLTQILINLLNNAVKFTDKGNVEFKIISEETDENNVLITFSVKDTGIGISKEKLAVIFNRFEQVSGELEKTYGGSGLGLSIVKTLSDIHKAEITIDSELGKGSEFIVKIPYTLTLEKTSDELSLEINENGNNLLRNIKILIGEDNILNQKLVRELLLRHGAIVDLVGSGERCIEALKTKHYDVVLMDLQLPKINGKEATQIIRNELQKNIPIIACTADTTVNEKEKCLEAGMNGYVPKPYSDSMLVSEITRVLNVEQDDSVNDFNSENLSENVSSVSEVPLNKDNEARKLEEERITKEKAAAEAAKKAAAAAAAEEEEEEEEEERIAKEKAEQEAAARKLEEERIAKEKAAAEAAKKAEEERIAKEKADQEAVARKLEEERIAKEKAAAEAAKKAEEERIAKEKAEQEAAAKKLEEERIAKEKAAAEAAKKAEEERIAKEEAIKKSEEERAARHKAEQVAIKKAESEKKAKELAEFKAAQKEKEERIAKAAAEAAKEAEKERIAKEKADKEKAEELRVAKEKAEAAKKIEEEKIAKQKAAEKKAALELAKKAAEVAKKAEEERIAKEKAKKAEAEKKTEVEKQIAKELEKGIEPEVEKEIVDSITNKLKAFQSSRGKPFTKELIEEFNIQIEKYKVELHQLLTEKDYKLMSKKAHKTAGLLSVFGFSENQYAKDLQIAATAGNKKNIEEACLSLMRAINKVLVVTKRYNYYYLVLA